MSANFDKLKAIMREMFQLDQAELDFGIYRIMNQKRDDIEKFLDKDLLPQVQEAFSAYQGTDQKAVKEELEKLRKTLEDAGVVAEDAPKFKSLQEKLSQSFDVTALENEVFSHLANFFRRYYQGGDFLSLRRYKAGVYAIPYEGEEVKLHWANADQYYIKSSENFRDYIFKLQSGKKVHFKLIEATSEQSDKKEQTGKERRFILTDETPLVVDNDELYIRFEYRIADENSKQNALNEASVQTIFATAETDWTREMSALAPTDKNPRRTLLEKHLNDYTAKYAFDYFIHKDLGGFMRRELDFFIKNEVLFIDDLDADHVKSSIVKVKVVKGIGLKIIDFLEQLENFQKKIWLKKKFVVETGYCVTLDRVPEELHSAIIANKAQLEEWKRLFSIQDIEGDLHTPKFSDPLTTDFLKANPYLVLDTACFAKEFNERLLASFDNLEESTNGLLVKSDNFHALNLLSGLYYKKINGIFIDPPYNTGLGDFAYKDNYLHSSWMSMMHDRIKLSHSMLADDGSFWATIDDNECNNLRGLSEAIFSESCFISDIAWEKVYSPRMDAKQFSTSFDHVLVFSRNPGWSPNRLTIIPDLSQFPHKDEDGRRYRSDPLRKWGKNSLRSDRPNLWYPIESSEGAEVWPIKPDGTEACWRWEKKTVAARYSELDWLDKGNGIQPYLRQYADNSTDRPVETIWKWDEAGSTHESQEELKAIVPKSGFTTPKPTRLIQKVQQACLKNNGIFIDFFAGSGSTGHATINQNRDDNGARKYILIEMGEYFDTVLKPRIQRTIHSKDWRDGKPVSREGSSHLFKYIRLESYEDALNNLQMKRTESQQSLLDHNDKLREEYMLSYMLDVESHGSASLLNVDEFKDPFGYQMKIARGNETKDTTIDLMETFNYLLAIKVLRISAPERRTAEFERDVEGRLQIKGKPRSCAVDEGWMFREVEGTTLAGEKVLIIWRTLTGNAEEDNLMLETYFSKRNYSTLDFEFSRIYVNGDNNLENLKIGDEQWKVALIEEEFKRLMFDVEGV